MTFSKQMESRDRTEGDRGVLSENIFREFCKAGSAKEGEVTGLWGGEPKVEGPMLISGGKSKSEKRG